MAPWDASRRVAGVGKHGYYGWSQDIGSVWFLPREATPSVCMLFTSVGFLNLVATGIWAGWFFGVGVLGALKDAQPRSWPSSPEMPVAAPLRCDNAKYFHTLSNISGVKITTGWVCRKADGLLLFLITQQTLLMYWFLSYIFTSGL